MAQTRAHEKIVPKYDFQRWKMWYAALIFFSSILYFAATQDTREIKQPVDVKGYR
jgi:hypothetical protein